MRTSIKVAILNKNCDLPSDEMTICGWVRNVRKSKNVSFIILNDGSTFENIQVVVDAEIDISKVIPGTSIKAVGRVVESKGPGQDVDFEVDSFEILGEVDETYPMQAKKHSMEFYREHPHLRARTKLFQAIFSVRGHLKMLVYEHFYQRGYVQVDTPIISGSDCEGAGEMFHVTTTGNSFDSSKIEPDHFFGQEVGLTVSGQLEAETAALGLGKVFTFGPTFRAENSNTSRHLSEFWMMEPEIAFADIDELMKVTEEFLRLVLRELLDRCPDELKYLEDYIIEEEKGLKEADRSTPLTEKLKSVDDVFERVSYTEAFDILRNSKPNKKGRFEFPVENWGMDLQSEHERYLVEKHFKKPVIVYNYPRDLKAFYMRDNEDGKTVAAMDVLFPGIGEIVGGSQREERLQVLKEKMTKFDIPHSEMQWFIDTRKFGTVPHAGFGLGFERLVQFATGMKNIKDVIMYPRTPGNLS